MQNKKTIPCRVCKKMFVPCAYCQSHANTFRWRNFACSIECAKKYIEEATNYRNSLNQIVVEETPIENTVDVSKLEQPSEEIMEETKKVATKKKNKKVSESENITEDTINMN